MRRLVFVTQRLDRTDPILGATVGKVRALAKLVDELVIICDSASDDGLPPNCRVQTFGATSQLARGARMTAALAAELRPRPVGVVAHMVPLYALLTAPLVRPLGVPLVLWYTHWANSSTLRAAERVSTAVASVDESSFPFATKKLHAVGHGIDLDELPCTKQEPSATFRMLVLGRYSRGKGLAEILDAHRQLRERGLDVALTMHGPTGNADERAHLAELRRLATDGARLDGPVPHTSLPEVFARADVLVSNHASPDKAVYEAAAACLPILARHRAFDELVTGIEPRLRFERGDLADAVAALASVPAPERHAIGERLRERVAARHSVDHWAAAILSLCR